MAQAKRPVLLSPEYEFEPQHGLPERLPADEKLLWQGAPSAWWLAVRAFHLRKLAIYFIAMLAWQYTSALDEGTPAGTALRALAWPMVAYTFALGLLGGLAWLAARTTAYTLTDRRVVMRIGIVLTVSFNLPLTRIEAAALSGRADGSGDVALTLDPATRIGWWNLWPHVRAWQLRRPQPVLRCLEDATAVSALLAKAWADANGAQVVPTASPAPLAPFAPNAPTAPTAPTAPQAPRAARRPAAETQHPSAHAFPGGASGLAAR